MLVSVRFVILVLSLALGVVVARAQTNYYETPAQIRGLKVEERIGRVLPMDLEFTDETGRVVRLGEYFTKTNKPAVITLVYYNCPMVCDLMLTKQAEVLSKLDYMPGKEFNTLVFSFDARETPEQAARAKKAYLAMYDRRDAEWVDGGWRYHVGSESNNRALADALGFEYRQLSDGNFSHPLVQFIVTPEGKISRYLYGYPGDTRDLKLAIIEASEGKVRRTVGEVILSWCYEFDATVGKYTLRVVRIMQVGMGVTVLVVGGAIASMLFAERFRRRRVSGDGQPTSLQTADGVRS
jgi:protein SCO1/2